MEAHYFQNDCFMQPNQLLAEAGQLAGIPGIIVQGRYDLLCPPATSHALAAAVAASEVRFVEGAGHSLYDPGVRDAVMKAIADLASRAIADKRTALSVIIPGGLNPAHDIRRACCTAAKTGNDVNVTALRLMKAVDQAKLALWIMLIGSNKITL